MIAAARMLGLAGLLCLPGAMAQAQSEPAPDAERAFVVSLQQAVGKDDKQWIAEHCAYPVRVGLPGFAQAPDRASLIRRYGVIFTPKLKAAILAQDPDQLFHNYQGTMVGAGATNIWIRSSDWNGPSDKPDSFSIITINTAR